MSGAPATNVASKLAPSWEPCTTSADGLVLGRAAQTEHVGFSHNDKYLVLIARDTGRDFRGRLRQGIARLVLVSPARGARADVGPALVVVGRSSSRTVRISPMQCAQGTRRSVAYSTCGWST